MHNHSFSIPVAPDMSKQYIELLPPPPPFPSDICVDCPAPAKRPWRNPINPANKEDKTPMASYASATVVNPASVEIEQRETVRSALRKAYGKISDALHRQFGLTDDAAPTSPAAFVQRILDGKYTIDKEAADSDMYSARCAAGYIRWRDPSVVEDKAGYKAAAAKLDEAYSDAKLKAALLPVSDLLKLVDDFKAFTA